LNPDAEPSTLTRDVAGHVRESIDAMTEQRARVYRDVKLSQHVVEWLTEHLGTPRVVLAILAIIAIWIGSNIALRVAGHAPFDPYPFPALQGLLSFSAVLMALLILTTENRLAASADHRGRLALQMGIVTEQKVAKIIALIEEQRRDDPNLRDRTDVEAEAMTEIADTFALSEALDVSNHAMLHEATSRGASTSSP
jgi:uncharacterized membrane protein